MQKTTVQLIDDLDGDVISDGEGRTIQFSFDGAGYELDLTNENIEKLATALAPFIGSARSTGRSAGTRSTGRTASRTSSSSSSSSSADLQAIRDWANANGYIVGDRGRIKSSIREAYDKAH